MSCEMFIVTKKPGKPPEAKWVDAELEAFQRIVKGSIERVPIEFPGNLSLWVNEDGPMRGLQSNLQIGHQVLVGTCYIRGEKGMSTSEVEFAGGWLEKYSIEYNFDNCHICRQTPHLCIDLPECAQHWKKRAVAAEAKLKEKHETK